MHIQRTVEGQISWKNPKRDNVVYNIKNIVDSNSFERIYLIEQINKFFISQ